MGHLTSKSYLDLQKRLDMHYDDKLDEKIRINGVVKNVIEKDKVMLITIENSCSALVVSFDDVSVKEGDNIEVVGTVKEYKGKTEVVAEEIRKG